ncbi:MAG: DNA-processing protein DprA [Succinivibrionaceae bacterium]|nr:DNA-processing protein DprA [Succinivibrionaceae bacterium]
MRKEYILALLYGLKTRGIKGVGPKAVLKIAQSQASMSLAENGGREDAAELYACVRAGDAKLASGIDENVLAEALDAAYELIDKSREKGIELVGYGDENYPPGFYFACDGKGVKTPPPLFWYKGDIGVLSKPGVAVIGTREPTPEGGKAGYYMGRIFAEKGFNVVSGLALGCDASAHSGALAARGVTTAILPSIVEPSEVMPRSHQRLAEEILSSGGLLMSEYPLGHAVSKFDYVDRDRLQAALAAAVIVVQSKYNGGSMHASNAALKAQKPVYVLKYLSDKLNRSDITSGNRLLAERGAEFISGQEMKAGGAKIFEFILKKHEEQQARTLPVAKAKKQAGLPV